MVGLSLWFLFFLACASSKVIRYSRITQEIEGAMQKPFAVKTKGDCAFKTFTSNNIAYKIFKRDNGTMCQIISIVSSFETALESGIDYYLLHTRPGKEGCSAVTSNLREMLSGACPLKDKCGHYDSWRDTCQKKDSKCGVVPPTTPAITTTTISCEENSGRCCPFKEFRYSKNIDKCIGIIDFSGKAKDYTHKTVFGQCPSGSTPVSVHNQEQNNDIFAFVPEGKGAIIGFHIPEGQPWSKDGFRWYDNSPVDYKNWPSEGPKNEGGNEFFVAIVNKLGWGRLWVDYGADMFRKDNLESIICMVTPQQM